MYHELYNLLLEGIFGGSLPSSLSAYMLEFFTLICIYLVVGVPFFMIYALVRRWL